MTADLVAERTDRVFGAMAETGIDVLVLGTQANANYASGMFRLWTAGTRPFGPGCVLVGATGAVHVLSSWREGVPESIPFENLYGITWNPQKLGASLTAIPGFADAATIGVDALSPGFRRAVGKLAPGAELAAAEDLMSRVRRTKLPAEVNLIRAACGVAWRAAVAASTDGLAGAQAVLAAAGRTVPSSESLCREIDEGTVVDIGILFGHYEGGAGGVFAAGERISGTELVGVCRAGAARADLAAAASGEWLVRGLGMGFEAPVIAEDVGVGESLEAGMVVSVSDGHHRDVVHVTESGPQLLSGV